MLAKPLKAGDKSVMPYLVAGTIKAKVRAELPPEPYLKLPHIHLLRSKNPKRWMLVGTVGVCPCLIAIDCDLDESEAKEVATEYERRFAALDAHFKKHIPGLGSGPERN